MSEDERAIRKLIETCLAASAAGGEAVRRSGPTLSIFRKRPDGSWLLARDANLLARE